MSTPVKIAVLSFIISFLISLSHPLITYLYLRKTTDPVRWIQNNPSYTIFLLSSFPAAVAIFSATMNLQVISYWAADGRLPVFVLAIALILLIVTLTVRQNFTSHPIAPYVLKQDEVAKSVALETDLRRAAASGRFRSNSLTQKRKDYQELIHLKSIREGFESAEVWSLMCTWVWLG